MFEILTYPFMQRAIVAGVIIALLLSALGVFVLARRMAFFGDGVAHASLAGIAIGLLAGFAPLPIAMVYAVFVALLIYWFEQSTRLSSDAIIGILFTSSMALGVVLLSFIPGYQPELIGFLFGNILAIQSMDIWLLALVAFPILIWLFVWRKSILFTSIDEDSATVSGIPTLLHTILLYITLAVSVVLGVKILGIILVSALLVTPAATSRLFNSSFKGFFTSAIIISEFTVITGLLLSFLVDAPSGAMIILVSSAVFFIVAIGHKLLVR
jgi:zinc transport system permease protein